jgi:hypothetical protein
VMMTSSGSMTVYDYADVAKYGTVVWSEDQWTFVTWNGSATFNVWARGYGTELFFNVDCFTAHDVVNDSEARAVARDRFSTPAESR